jgi:hypothetical protein
MARAKSISIPVTGNTAPLRKALKEAQKDLTLFGRATQKFGQAQNLAFGLAGSAAFGYATRLAKVAEEASTSRARIDQIANSMGLFGLATGQVTDRLVDYANATARATGIDQNAIKQTQAKLLTFKELAKSANVVGAEFDRATQAAIDLQAAGFGDATNNAVQLGKALQDPIKGLTALRRSGITFTEAERERIRVLVESNRVSEAQREILSAIEKQVGGTAEATANATNKMAVSYQQLQEQLGNYLLPTLDKVAGKFDEIAQTSEKRGPIVGLAKGALELARGLDPARQIAGLLRGQLQNLGETLGIVDEKTASVADKYRALSEITLRITAQGRELGAAFSSAGDGFDEAAEAADKAKEEFDLMVDSMRRQLEAITAVNMERAAAARQAAADAAEERKQAVANYKDQAAALRGTLRKALKDARRNLADAKKEAVDFGEALAYSFGVSLSSAFTDAKNSEDAYADALKARKDAYDALDIAKQGTDLNAYLKALQDVKTAEEGVTAAQAARITPAAAFADQIAAAKTFGTNLQTLVGQGLGQAGLQQLLDLGPKVGAEVTKEILAGTAGITVGGLNADLAALAGVQAGLAGGITAALAPKGDITAAQNAVDALSSASIGAPGFGQGITINIAAGVGDPVAIGAQVKSVLQSYDQRAGKLTVQTPKKKAKAK